MLRGKHRVQNYIQVRIAIIKTKYGKHWEKVQNY